MTFKWQLDKTTSDKNRSSVRQLVLEMDEGLRGNGLPVSYTHLTLPTIYSV